MLTDIYIEALLVDEEMADQVWDAGQLNEMAGCSGWLLISCSIPRSSSFMVGLARGTSVVWHDLWEEFQRALGEKIQNSVC